MGHGRVNVNYRAEFRNAPSDVRRWLRSIVDAEFLLDEHSEHGAQSSDTVLSPCTPEEAVAVFGRIRSDYLAAQVMLEPGRHTPHIADVSREVVGVTLTDIIRHARLQDPRQIGACLEKITSGFRMTSR